MTYRPPSGIPLAPDPASQAKQVGAAPPSGPDLCGLPALFQAGDDQAGTGTCQALEKHPATAMLNGMDGKAAIVKRSVRIAGHATSISLEPAFWDALREIAARRQVSVNALLSGIDAGRSGNLSSAIRVFVLESCRRGELAAVVAGAPQSCYRADHDERSEEWRRS